MKLSFEVHFKIGQIVFIRTDPDQYPRMITGYKVGPYDILYIVSLVSLETHHFDFELSASKDVIKSLGIDENSETA